MTFTLRPYQEQAVAAGVSFMMGTKPENGIIVAPTGSGKSLIIANIVQQLPGPCLIFQPSKEILEQNAAKLLAYGYRPAIYSASAGEKKVGAITLATIGSVVQKPDLFRHVRYVIIDEAHGVNAKDDNSMFVSFLNRLGDVRILGLTATPYRLSTDGFGGSILKFLTRTRPRVFQKVVHVIQNGDLFRSQYLARLEYKQVKTGFDQSRLRLNTTGADYTDESVRRHFKELNFSDQIVRCVHRLHELNRGSALVFTRFVEEAEYVASRIPGAAIVTAQTNKKDRARVIDGFKAGRIPVVANVGVLTVGFDYPELANVILARPTMSLALYYQMIGRAVRPHPNKEYAMIIDMVGLSKQFGRVEDIELVRGENEKWFVRNRGRQLTNVYFGKEEAVA